MPEELLAREKPDWVFFNKAIDDASLYAARKLRQAGAKIVYDVDDHVLDYPPYSGAKVGPEQRDIILEFLQLSDVVTVANECLFYRYAAKCRRVAFLPNGIYVERYASGDTAGSLPHTLRPDGRLTVGFTNADFLKMITFRSAWLDAMNVVRAKHPDVRFAYFGDFGPDKLGLLGWDWLGSVALTQYREAIFGGVFDVALVPLGGHEDESSFEFNLCKNPFKYLEFGAAGVSGVFSRVPIYENVVTDFKTGRLVPNNIPSWIDATEMLITDRNLRQSFGDASKVDVAARFHIRHAAAAVENLIRRS